MNVFKMQLGDLNMMRMFLYDDIYVTLEHKTSQKSTFFYLLRFMHHLKAE